MTTHTPIRGYLLPLPASLMLAATAFAAPVDEAALTRSVAEQLQRELPGYAFTRRGPFEIAGTNPQGKETGQIGTTRVFDYCTRNEAQCAQATVQYAKGLAQSIKEADLPITLDMIRLALRRSSYIDGLKQQLGGKPGLLYTRPFAPGLQIVAVLDYSHSVRMLNDKDLDKLKLTEDEMFAAGTRNIGINKKPLAELLRAPPANGIGSIADEEYASSRLIPIQAWAGLARQLKGQLVVMVPDADVVLYADGGSSESVDAMRALGINISRQSSRPLSTAILKWSETGWIEQ